jgi:putative ABC transport system permease protein
MNIINKLTLRHLKENKRRTLVTIIGVIISVAMVTAVATLGISFLDLLKRQSIVNDGLWHVQYHDVNKKQLEAIEKDNATKDVAIGNNLGYALLTGSENEYKPYMFIKEFNKQGFENFPINVKEGRLPKSNNEIIITEEIANNAKILYQIGDVITMNIGNRFLMGAPEALSQNDPLQTEDGEISETFNHEMTKTYTVVGVMNRPNWEPTWSPGYTVISYTEKSLLKKADQVDAYVVLKKINRSLFEHSKDISVLNKISKVTYNSELLRFYGVTDNDSLRTTLFSLAAIIMVVIIVGSVALIFNAFAISVSERSRHLGMLASVGATKRQKRNSVFFEGAIIGLISIPIGIIAGLVGITITFWFINSFIEEVLGGSEQLKVIVTPISIIISCIISIITIFISTFSPARKASKISAIDAIRQTQDVKLTGKTVKTTKLVRKVFGIEAEIGLKNLKRNKRRYRATVFSLIISIVLFLSVSYFTNNLKKSLEMSQDGINYDIRISVNQSGNPEELEAFKNLDFVTDYSIFRTVYLSSWLDEALVTSSMKEYLSGSLKDGKYFYTIVLHAIDDESFMEYAKHIGVKNIKQQNAGKPLGIVVDQISYQDYKTGKFYDTKVIDADPGTTIDLVSMNIDNNKEVFLNSIEIAALTDQTPMGEVRGGLGGLDIFVPESMLDTIITEDLKYEVQNTMYLISSDPMKTQSVLEDRKSSGTHVYNIYQAKQQEEQLIMFMSIFTYGFTVLITLISIANIFNTISTSISIRKREFAMLKSVGMTTKGFNKMMSYESIFYGVKALAYGLPVSLGIMYLIYRAMKQTFEYHFVFPWLSVLYVIVILFIIVGSSMIYSIHKAKKENIIDALKQESI